jgi:hypothetical protein
MYQSYDNQNQSRFNQYGTGISWYIYISKPLGTIYEKFAHVYTM